MLVKLTYYKTGQPTLINLNQVESIYQVYDKTCDKHSTKIQFKGSYVNVEETLDEILDLQNHCMTELEPKEDNDYLPSWLKRH